jgi:acyl-CoA thioester hydrolase
MYHAEHHFLAATAEWLNLHVDLNVRKVAPWPDDIRSQIAAFADLQGDWGWPAEVGRQMNIAQPIYSSELAG